MSATATTSGAKLPSFDVLEDAVEGIVANARTSFSLATIARAAEHGEWSRTIDTTDALAGKLASLDIPAEAWREVLVAAAFFGVMADDIDAVRPTFEAFSTRAWPPETRKAMPWELAGVLDKAHRIRRLQAGRALGGLVSALFPTCPLGPLACAHFAERIHDARDADAPAAGEVAAQFEHAATLADALDMPVSAARSRLRAGVLLLRSKTSRARGRELLRGLDTADLSREDALWYAVGMAQSPFWLDRVRAADAVLQTLPVERDPRTGRIVEPPADTVAAARHMLECAPIELQPLEVDRLEALVDEVLAEVGEPDDAREALSLRAQLERVATAPASRAEEAADILSGSFGQQASAAQRAAVEFCRLVAEATRSERAVDLDPAGLERVAASFPAAAAVLEALAPAAKGGARRLATALGQLEGHLRQATPPLTVVELGPIALLWPRLLPFLGQLREEDDADPTTVRRIVASTAEILRRWLPRAHTPSYGWWTLAANLMAVEFPDEAILATRRAIDDGEQLDDDVEERVLAAVLDRTVREGSDEALLGWLEVAEERFGARSS